MPGDLKVRAILFDFYNTLVRILTDETAYELWDRLARYIRYHGVDIESEALRDEYFAAAEDGQRESTEAHPETDVREIFVSILARMSGDHSERLVDDIVRLFRVLSIRDFELYSDTHPTFASLDGRFRMGLVTDAQPLFFRPELRMLGLAHYLDVIVVSGDHGFHKPDVRLFDLALKQLQLPADEVVFVGDNTHRDICGAKQSGISAVLIDRNYSFNDQDAPCSPDYVIHDLSELEPLLHSTPARARRLSISSE